VVAAVERLQEFPRLGSIPAELRGLPYRQLVVPPCRIFYRAGKAEGGKRKAEGGSQKVIYIVHVLRGEQLVRKEQFPTRLRASKPSAK
jgi:plasmid stabilization system protein ParE